MESGMESNNNKSKKKIISLIIYHHKGGVGKSLLSTWLAYLLAKGGLNGEQPKLNVALIDLDSQQNASKTYLEMVRRIGVPYPIPPYHPDFVPGDPENGTWDGISTSSDILYGEQFVYYTAMNLDNLKILPSEGRVERISEIIANDNYIPHIGELAKEFLDQEEEIGELDVIIFDTPPSKTSICEGFLSACSHTLIPTQLEYDSVESIPLLFENFRLYNEMREVPIEVVGVIPNLVSSTSMTNMEIEQYKKLFGIVDDYQKENNLENLLPSDFFLVNRVAFKPRKKPDDLDTVFNLKKDKKAEHEMTKLFEFVTEKLGVYND